jgi:hypothetical protein
MVYDSQQHVTLLYGGIGGNGTATETLGDTWMWDGANWTLAPLATPNPPARAYHGMSFDAARGVSVIFGGLGAVNYVDTWLGGFGITAPLTLTTNGSVETEGIPDNIGPATVSGGTPPYSASIDWGDGTTSSATFNGFQVVGNHLYVEEGTYPVNVVVTDSSGSRIAATTTTFVSDAPLYAQGAGNMNVSRKKAFTARVASFNDQDPGGAVTDYNASIDWGDGTTTAASSISFAGGLTFNVYGTHAYAVKGTYSVTTRISDSGGATADPVVTTIVVNGT